MVIYPSARPVSAPYCKLEQHGHCQSYKMTLKEDTGVNFTDQIIRNRFYEFRLRGWCPLVGLCSLPTAILSLIRIWKNIIVPDLADPPVLLQPTVGSSFSFPLTNHLVPNTSPSPHECGYPAWIFHLLKSDMFSKCFFNLWAVYNHSWF